MASREEQKKKAREERERKQQEEAEAKKKRKRRIRILTGVGVVLVAAIAAFVLLSGKSETKKSPLTADKEKGQVTPGPWNTGSDGLGERVRAMGLPDPSDTVFHVHAQLTIYTNGKKQKIPQNVGIEPESQFITSLHTHTDDGVIHMEAVQPYPFKLGQFFEVWNVPFSASQIGGYHTGKGLELQTWVNGKKLRTDPKQYVMKAHDKVVVGFGKPGSFPTKSNFKFPAGE